jgi:acyl-CoA synthetase (AMP-forming)/AMP-acid ligase II
LYWTYEFILKKYDSKIRNKWTVKEIVEANEHLNDKVYLVFAPTGKEFTYKESNEISNKYAHSLTSLGLKKGDRVGIYLANSPEYIFLLFAIAKLGLIEVPINPNFQENEIAYMINIAEIPIIITDSILGKTGVLNKIEQNSEFLKTIVYVDSIENSHFDKVKLYSLEDLSKEALNTNPNIEIKGSDPFNIMFTSGTTGLPKGAITSHKTAILAALMMGATHDENDRNYTCLPLFHANAQLYSTIGMRALGATVIISDKFSASNFFHEIQKYNATSFNAIGGMIQILDSIYSEENVPKHSATKVFVGGASKDLWEQFEDKFNLTIFEGYSMTEAPAGFQNVHPDKKERRIGSFGKPCFMDLDRGVKIVDEKNNEIKVGIGELLVKGPAFLTLGYWNAPEVTKAAFDSEGWFKTGDIVRVDEDGYYYFVDRYKFMVRVGGENVSAFEVEEVINSHPAVKQSAAIPVPDLYKDEEIKIFIIPNVADEEIDFKELVGFCNEKLAVHKIPRYYELIDELPRTPTEKIQKHQLKEEEKLKEYHGWDRNIEFAEWRKPVHKH